MDDEKKDELKKKKKKKHVKMDARILTASMVAVLIISTLGAASILPSNHTDESIVLVDSFGHEDISILNQLDLNIIDRYGSYTLVEADEDSISALKRSDVRVNRLPDRTTIYVKGHEFDFTQGEPSFEDDLTIEGYEKGVHGLYIVHMLGPINPQWRERLEETGVQVINYVPNYAFEVKMTLEQAEKVEDFYFVDWVGIYQPGYKLADGLEPGLINIRLVNGADVNTLSSLSSEIDIISTVDMSTSGIHILAEVRDESSFSKIAQMNDVYYVSNYIEPRLTDEMATQLIGGGLWFMDDEDDDPDTAYRLHGDYGSYINQIGYKGAGVVTAVADTGIGDGSVGDAGHPDFTGRVIGGMSFGSGGWADGHSHGTHCAGSVAGDTHHGTGQTIYEDYYSGQGSAPETELYAVQIFDGGGGYIGPDDIYDIAEVAKQDADAYVHSNSWGAPVEGAYDSRSERFDLAVRDSDSDSAGNQPMSIVVASGNDGSSANTVGAPATGKNVLTIGANLNYYPDGRGGGNPNNIASFSSRGYTNDNRIKPDLVAPGDGVVSTEPGASYGEKSGTSMATPAAAGAAAVVVEWYEVNQDSRPSPAMVRALMINTAIDLDDSGNTGPIPNRDEGWGMVDISKLEYPFEDPVPFMLQDQESLLTTGETDEYQMQVDRADEPLKVSLTWTDRHALDGDDPALKNDLNLEVESPSGLVYRGNAFSGGWTQADSDAMADFDRNGDGWDDTNNVENVYIHPDEVEMGTYTVRVIGYNIPEDANNDGTPNQDYALVGYNVVDEIPGEPPSVTVTRPNGGESWIGTVQEEITWSTQQGDDPIDSIDLLYSTDGGSSWTSIESGIDDTGIYGWTVPNINSDQCLVRVRVRDEIGRVGEDNSDDVFEIVEAIPPEISLTSPTGGEVWYVGDEEYVTWSADEGDDPIDHIDLYYSTDSGSSWNEIDMGLPDIGSYSWTIPNEASEMCLVRARVTDTYGRTSEDISLDHFEIVAQPPTITLLSPTGGEEWDAGTQQDILWSSEQGDGEITCVDLEYSTDGGLSWDIIAEDLADTGSYTWTLPNEHSSDSSVRITLNDDNGLSDTKESDYFDIIGIPPSPPTIVSVEHHGDLEPIVAFEEDFTGVSEGDIPAGWTRGSSYWGVVDNDEAGGTAPELRFGNLPSGSGTIRCYTPAIDTSDQTEFDLKFRHYFDHFFGDSVTLMVETSTDGSSWTDVWSVDTASNIPAEEISVLLDEDDGIGSETLQISWTFFGNANNIRRWSIDDISLSIDVESDGTEHNLLTWSASPDDNDISHYNIYRSENHGGPWGAPVTSKDAVGADVYDFVDRDKGSADDILWWYLVRAVGINGLEEENTDAVQEPGAELDTFEVQLESNVDADGWNFVSFNLIPSDSSLISILEDQDNGIAGNYDKVMYYDSSVGMWSSYVPGRADHFNDLNTWNHRMGLWIRMTTSDTLIVEGSIPTSTTITLDPGWNMVGLPSGDTGNLGIPEQVDRVGYFDASQQYNIAYDEAGTFSFEPGKAYWIHNPTDSILYWEVSY